MATRLQKRERDVKVYGKRGRRRLKLGLDPAPAFAVPALREALVMDGLLPGWLYPGNRVELACIRMQRAARRTSVTEKWGLFDDDDLPSDSALFGSEDEADAAFMPPD